jgi:hypothetical protein
MRFFEILERSREGFAGFRGGLFVGDVAIAGGARCTHVTQRLTNERQISSCRNQVAGKAVFDQMRVALPLWQSSGLSDRLEESKER